MPFHWQRRIQFEPWRALRLEIRSIPAPRSANKDRITKERLRATLREEITAEGGRRIPKSTINFDPRDLPEILHAFQSAVDALPIDALDIEIPPPPDHATWARLHRHLMRRQVRDDLFDTPPPLDPPYSNDFWPDYVRWAQEIGLIRALEAFLSRQ